MIINLSPQRSDAVLVVSKQGDALTINGVTYDFSQLPEGASLPASAIECQFILDSVERNNGELELTLVLPHGANASEDKRFPKPIINPVDGVLELP